MKMSDGSRICDITGELLSNMVYCHFSKTPPTTNYENISMRLFNLPCFIIPTQHTQMILFVQCQTGSALGLYTYSQYNCKYHRTPQGTHKFSVERVHNSINFSNARSQLATKFQIRSLLLPLCNLNKVFFSTILVCSNPLCPILMNTLYYKVL